MWDLIIYGSMATGGVSFITVCLNILHGRHEHRRGEIVASNSALRLKAYYSLGNNGPNPYAERDKHGFLISLDWSAVADLEHSLGFTHSEEAEAVCSAKACWKENQNPEYTMLNGFLTMNEIRSLKQETLIIDPDSMDPLLKKDSSGRYQRVGYTEPSLRELAETTPDGGSWSIEEQVDAQPYKAATDHLLKIQERNEELFKLAMDAMKKYTGQTMVVPDGMEVTPLYKHGDPEPYRAIVSYKDDGWVQIDDAPTGVTAMMTPAQARRMGFIPADQSRTVGELTSDRRRDAPDPGGDTWTSLDGVGRGLNKQRPIKTKPSPGTTRDW